MYFEGTAKHLAWQVKIQQTTFWNIFFLFFSENRIWYFMQIVFLGLWRQVWNVRSFFFFGRQFAWNVNSYFLHGKNKKNITNLSSVEFAHSMLSVNWTVDVTLHITDYILVTSLFQLSHLLQLCFLCLCIYMGSDIVKDVLKLNFNLKGNGFTFRVVILSK